MTQTVTPEFMDVQMWADRNVQLLNRYGTIGSLRDPEKWREWAQGVASLPALAALGCPGPTGFSTWQDWARAYNVSARLLVT